MNFMYLGVYQYQCGSCQRTNLRRIVVPGETLEDANRTVRSRVRPCVFCLKKLAEGAKVTIEVRRTLPGEHAETAEAENEAVKEGRST